MIRMLNYIEDGLQNPGCCVLAVFIICPIAAIVFDTVLDYYKL
jgi:hypothetical protein